MKYRYLIALAATVTGTAFGGLSAPLPEFKTPSQLAAWRAEKAAKPAAQSTTEDPAFYTGKPYVASTGGYAFKYRSYNPELARWTSEDPSGFPDGANGNIYNNNPLVGFDPNGLAWSNANFLWHFYFGNGATVNLVDVGLLQSTRDSAERSPDGGQYRFQKQIERTAMAQPHLTTSFTDSFSNSYDFSDVLFVFGSGVLSGSVNGTMTHHEATSYSEEYTYWNALGSINYNDAFTDPTSIIEFLYGSSSSSSAPSWLAGAAQLGGTPFNVVGVWGINEAGTFACE